MGSSPRNKSVAMPAIQIDTDSAPLPCRFCSGTGAPPSASLSSPALTPMSASSAPRHFHETLSPNATPSYQAAMSGASNVSGELRTAVHRRIREIEGLNEVIPDITLRCPRCSLTSVISYEYHMAVSFAFPSCTQQLPENEDEYFARIVEMYHRRKGPVPSASG